MMGHVNVSRNNLREDNCSAVRSAAARPDTVKNDTAACGCDLCDGGSTVSMHRTYTGRRWNLIALGK